MVGHSEVIVEPALPAVTCVYLAVATAGSMIGNVLEVKNLCHPNTLSAAASACRWPSSLLPRYRRSITVAVVILSAAKDLAGASPAKMRRTRNAEGTDQG